MILEKDYIKEFDIANSNGNSHQLLMKNIENVRKNLERDYNNMQFIDDKNLVDYYTYKIKSEQAQYDYLIKQAKKTEDGTYL